MRIPQVVILALAIPVVGLVAYTYGNEQNPAKPPSVSHTVITTAWSGQNTDVSASFARARCTSYTVTITNRGTREQPWKLIVNRSVFGSGTMPPHGTAPTQHVPIKDGNDIQLAIEYGNGLGITTLYNQPVPGKRDC